MNLFKNSKLFFWTVEVLLLIVIFNLLHRVSFVFYPIKVIFLTLFAPVVIALFLYYLFNPIVSRLGKLNIPKPLSLLAILASFLIFIMIIFAGIIPEMVQQASQLILSLPAIVENASNHLNQLMEGTLIEGIDIQSYFEGLDLSVLTLLTSTLSGFFSGVGNVVGSLWSAGVTIITVPVILIYLFKDGPTLFEKIVQISPKKHQKFLENIFTSIHETLHAYISGQAMVCLYVGVSLFLVYTIAGLPYAFLLGILAGVMDIIPYAGPWIAAIPAIIVAFSVSPFVAIVIGIAMVVVQLGESYIVSPYVMGKSLHLHPIVVIFVLLIAGQLSGLVGMILGIPVFMIIKIIIQETTNYLTKKSPVEVQEG